MGLQDSTDRIRIASYILAGIALLGFLELHLVSALLAGLLVFEVVEGLIPLIRRLVPGERARLIAVVLVAVVVVGAIVLLVVATLDFYRRDIGDPRQLWDAKLAPLVDKAREQLPAWITTHLPDSVTELRAQSMELAHKHAGDLQLVGTHAARMFAHILIGLVLGAIVAISHGSGGRPARPLAFELTTRTTRLADAFHNIIFAQLKISAINTALAAIFLLVALPLFGVQVPLAKTLVIVTFIVGLLPVVGNLISNTLITVAGLSVSLWVGVAALGFLVVVHKLEYFLNARIVGGQIRARTWELLVAMLVFEAAFGLAGLVAGPIYYAYLKSELEAEGLV
ncbi:AI-2E family transporter [Luteibacter sp. PPL201]|jgi:predicted PurR-regulated permease PerM|uniref:AI-2E family transporter n=1 Tax=Luteibacter sahnii TaxID=3021977 RepID=A0ABT6BF15_9GAMM|nr:AI-2E family transporter [Luteibacter sp. PPL193]MDY1549645.1 AI-2E family transporter [Luteibacter sp. PPL193]